MLKVKRSVALVGLTILMLASPAPCAPRTPRAC